MRRILTAILAQIHAIRFHPGRLGLDRIGSHVEENYIGTIRQRCHHDDRHKTVFKAVSGMEFVKSHMPDLGFGCRLSSQANLGGLRVTGDGYSHIPFESPVQLADSLLRGLNLSARPTRPKMTPLDSIIDWMIDVAMNDPSGVIPFCSAVSGAQIVSRLLLFRPSSQTHAASKPASHCPQSRSWTIQELQLLKGAIKEDAHDISTLELLLPAKTRKRITAKFRELST
jgi:hypothetical protein